MANSYTQTYIHLVFAVKYRQCLIHDIKDDLYKYITGVIQSPQKKCKPLAIGGMPDHVHILIGLHPRLCLADLAKDIKVAASIWINSQNIYMGRFHWQDGYGAFSLGASQLESAIQYIRNQTIHHKTKTFREEYISFLNKYGIEYDERFIFGDLI